METQMHQWVKEDTRKVKLMKMSKGYQWEITYEESDNDAILKVIKDLDTKLHLAYDIKEGE